MTTADERAPWTDAAWLEEATTWIERQLARAGVTRDGDIEQPHVQWWSTALRVPTTGGVLWFKAPQPGGAFEVRLTRLLSAVRPEETAEVLASDDDRGWMLTRDAGVRVREVDDGPSLERWEELLPRYAELQLELAPRADELVTLGVPDLRLAVLPTLLRKALDDPAVVLVDREGGLSTAEHAALIAALPRFEAACRELARAGVPETLQHDDFHDGNVFVRDGRHVFFDWGDACVSHPFHTLVVTLRALAYRYRLSPGGRAITRSAMRTWSRGRGSPPATSLRPRRSSPAGRGQCNARSPGTSPPTTCRSPFAPSTPTSSPTACGCSSRTGRTGPGTTGRSRDGGASAVARGCQMRGEMHAAPE